LQFYYTVYQNVIVIVNQYGYISPHIKIQLITTVKTNQSFLQITHHVIYYFSIYQPFPCGKRQHV